MKLTNLYILTILLISLNSHSEIIQKTKGLISAPPMHKSDLNIKGPIKSLKSTGFSTFTENNNKYIRVSPTTSFNFTKSGLVKTWSIDSETSTKTINKIKNNIIISSSTIVVNNGSFGASNSTKEYEFKYENYRLKKIELLNGQGLYRECTNYKYDRNSIFEYKCNSKNIIKYKYNKDNNISEIVNHTKDSTSIKEVYTYNGKYNLNIDTYFKGELKSSRILTMDSYNNYISLKYESKSNNQETIIGKPVISTRSKIDISNYDAHGNPLITQQSYFKTLKDSQEESIRKVFTNYEITYFE